MVHQPSYWKVLTRRKILPSESGDGESKLNRVLGLYDLTALGVGSTLGAGVYVLAGQIAKEQAGPSVMLSFAIAALASLLAGVCYAEFGARVPKAGSAYVYSYVCIGEFAAFVIGWNLILEYMIGTASVCRGISLYLDTLINDTLKTTFSEVAPMHVSFLGSYFDFFAFGLVVVFGVALAFGVETSTMANNFCTCINISILLFVIIAGSIKANFDNWFVDVSSINATDTTSDVGNGGFFPFGFQGTLKGAATCFFGFVGFDCIATTGEEVRNPRRNIPRSILLSLLIIFLCYFGVSTVLTLMVPYYLQDPNAPLPYAFKQVGWNFAMWIVAIGGLIGLLASLFGALFPLPRVMYSMAEDGLLFRFLGKVSPRFRVPVVGSIFAAMITAMMAGLFDLAQLVNLLSIGTLLAYSVVAISVTILRYMDNSEDTDRENGNQPLTENAMLTSSGTRITAGAFMSQLFNFKRLYTPNSLTTFIVGTLITIFCLLSLGIGLIFMEAYDALIHNQLWVLVLLGILVILTFIVMIAICLQPREAYTHLFRVPFVPIVPAISIFINIYLMLQLDVMTWIRFGIWMAIGIPMFIACWCMYDIKNPEKRNPNRIEFEKALKVSALEIQPLNGNLKVESLESNGVLIPTENNAGANGGTTLTAQNEHSVKSLDEIMNLNEVSEELIEMKHPNGKIFYIEDTKSNTSTVTLEKDEENKGGGSDTTEDEKSVIALLDDVLQAEDDDTGGTALQSPTGISNYSRKFSIDSEMMPSVIETTTVATVHSSSDSSDKDLDELPEVEHDNWLGSSVLNTDFARYHASQQVARQLVDELLESDDLWSALEAKITLRDIANSLLMSNEKENDIDIDIKPTEEASSDTLRNSFQRSHSIASVLSTQSIEDPIHSMKFKDKLSKILMAQPAPLATIKLNKEHKDSDGSENSRPQLKHSKSEADVRQLVLRAIEGTGRNLDDDTEGSNTLVKDANGIPKAPKFDPVLYKTVNNPGTRKTRPSIDKMRKKSEEPKIVEKVTVAISEPQPEELQVPFKLKLAAILTRGPSHRTQQRPEVQQRRPKSMGATAIDGLMERTAELEEEEETKEVQRKRWPTRSESESATAEGPAEAINDARKTLKSVKKGPQLS